MRLPSLYSLTYAVCTCLLLGALATLQGCTSTSNGGGNPNPAPIEITTATLPDGQMGAAYSARLSAIGGTAPYSWLLTSGTLPAGLSLNASIGAITGTPTVVASNTPLTFRVTDSSNPSHVQSANFTLTVSAATLVISMTFLPNGQVGTAYSATLVATGGTAPYTWSVTSGTLPSGLSLNASTGAITGSPTSAVTSAPLTFKVTDSSNPVLTQSANTALTISAAPLVISTTSLPNGQVGTAYSATLVATGGTAPYTWSVTSGTLPSGLSLNASTGAITGSPTSAVTSAPLTFKVTDSSNPVLTQSAKVYCPLPSLLRRWSRSRSLPRMAWCGRLRQHPAVHRDRLLTLITAHRISRALSSGLLRTPPRERRNAAGPDDLLLSRRGQQR